ncbi:MAG: hypothetical protein L6R36_009387 [Xanthoria steineri]|nr:MAG: hypothetical protein L6R36_009387 [Xanthoria steineri]
MERHPRSPEEADKLLHLADLLRDAALAVKDGWAKEDFSAPAIQDTARILPSPRLWEATRTIESISGALFFESRALFIAAERRIPDLLAQAAGAAPGLDIDAIAAKTGIHAGKLCTNGSLTPIFQHLRSVVFANLVMGNAARIMRTLCTTHVFQEIDDNQFANNRVSEALVRNEGLLAYVQLS